jgi:hypothetical protein
MLYLCDSSKVAIIGEDEPSQILSNLLADYSGLAVYSTDCKAGIDNANLMLGIMEMSGDNGWIVRGPIAEDMVYACLENDLPPPDYVIDLTGDGKFENQYRKLDDSCPPIWLSIRANHLIGGGPSGTSSSD